MLLLHGTESDATSMNTIDRMRRHHHLSVIHVHGAGHTPSLGDYGLTQLTAEWLNFEGPYNKDIEFRTTYNPIRLFYPDARRRNSTRSRLHIHAPRRDRGKPQRNLLRW